MKSDLIQKLCLGTVQFGIDYGIANKRGKIPSSEVLQILKYAADSGVKTLDTSGIYGDSEKSIGEILGNNSLGFEIVSKMALSNTDDSNIEKHAKNILKQTLDDLRAKDMYGCLVHSFNEFKSHKDLWETLVSAKKDKVAHHIGFSLYSPSELDFILEKDIPFDIVQLPYSVFDRRFEGYFKLLKDRGVKIFMRSAFLQGLAFLNPEDLTGVLASAEGSLRTLRGISTETSIPVHALCLNFCLMNPLVDSVVIGVDSLEQLKDNVMALDYAEKMDQICSEVHKVAVKDENVLLPYKWK